MNSPASCGENSLHVTKKTVGSLRFVFEKINSLILAVDVLKKDIKTCSSNRIDLHRANEIGHNTIPNVVVDSVALGEWKLLHFAQFTAMTAFI
jgi:hypothetical protein